MNGSFSEQQGDMLLTGMVIDISHQKFMEERLCCKVGASAHFASKIASLSIRISAPGPDRIFVCYRLSQAESVLNPHSER